MEQEEDYHTGLHLLPCSSNVNVVMFSCSQPKASLPHQKKKRRKKNPHHHTASYTRHFLRLTVFAVVSTCEKLLGFLTARNSHFFSAAEHDSKTVLRERFIKERERKKSCFIPEVTEVSLHQQVAPQRNFPLLF